MESLLVNGEEFFSGNPKIALQNLPAYTVKNIKVYNRASKDSYLKSEARKRLEYEENMVMDVTLKKQYMKGLIGNLDAGYGLPNNRYMGKAFALSYFRHTRLAAFVNLNNIKDTQTGSSGGYWDSGWNPDGEMDLQMGGIDINYKRNKVSYNGFVNLTREDIYTEKQTSSVNYFSTGNIYGRSVTKNQIFRKHLISKHQLEISTDRAFIFIKPNIDYKRDNSIFRNRLAEFSESPEESDRLESLDSLFAPSWTTSRYNRMLLNRQARENEESKERLNANGYALSTINLPHLANDLLKIFVSGQYIKDKKNPALSYLRQYGSASSQTGGNRLLQLTDETSESYNVSGKISYDWIYAPYQTGRTYSWTIIPALETKRHHQDQKQPDQCSGGKRYRSGTTDTTPLCHQPRHAGTGSRKQLPFRTDTRQLYPLAGHQIPHFPFGNRQIYICHQSIHKKSDAERVFTLSERPDRYDCKPILKQTQSYLQHHTL